MPWRETHPMDQGTQFVREAVGRHGDMTVLCAPYGISRKTGYKWLARHDEGGVLGLDELSRRPHRSPAAPARAEPRVMCYPMSLFAQRECARST